MRSTTSGFENLFAFKFDRNTSVRNANAGFDIASTSFTNNTAIANGVTGGARATKGGGTLHYAVHGNKTFDNAGTGLIVGALTPTIVGNVSSGNGTHGIDATGSSNAVFKKNRTLGNGFPTINNIGEGIHADSDATGHPNASWGNEADMQCEPATIC
jgi:hypothetical protein